MEVAESSCSEDGGSCGTVEELTRPLANRLHARVMAAAYKYRLMSSEEDGMGEGHQRGSGATSAPCLMKACLVMFAVIIVVLASLLGWSLNRAWGRQECLTAECVDVSAYILRKMNRSVDPCMDFYSYSCGGWESTNLIPPERAKYDTFAEINTRNKAIIRTLLEEESTLYKGHNSSAVAKLKMYYRTCMDTNKIQADGAGPILKKIEELGSWSISPGLTSRDSGRLASWDLVSALAPFNRLGLSPLFSFYLTIDPKNSSQHVFGFSQAGLTLSTEEEYWDHADRYRDAFLSFAVRVGKLLGGDNSTYGKMEAIYNFEKRLAEIFVKKEERRDPIRSYHKMTVATFQKIIGDQVDVQHLMSEILGWEVTDSVEVLVPTVDYFRKLGPVLANTSSQVLQDYLVWHMVQLLPGYLPQAFVDAALVLGRVERGTSSLSPRWQRCMYKAEAALGSVSSALYVDKTFPPESKTQALKIITEVQTAFIDNLEHLPWMDEETKVRAVVKAKAMDKGLGYPDWLLDPDKLDKHYEKMELKEGEFLNSYFAVSQYEMNHMWAKLGKMPDRDEWGSNPDEANAYFSFPFNRILIMAGLLQRPYFDPHYPLSFAYGAMAMISGHELSHGFDNFGRMYDEKGNLKDWWTQESSRAFQEHTQCFVDQYSDFTLNGTHLDGNYTLAENIADNAGLKLGYAAYLGAKARGEWEEPLLPAMDLTPQQLFFLGFAQIWCAHYTPEYAQHVILTDAHTMNRFRVQGSVANMPQFAEAFSCPAGSPLNPPDRCQVW